MAQLWEAIVSLGKAVGNLFVANQGWLVPCLLLFAWVAWWLWAVNWPKMWVWLRQGAWAPLVLLLLWAALAWSQLAPSSCDCRGVLTVPNFWWQLGAMGLLIAVALFCGWLQDYLGWTPAEVPIGPPAYDHGHDAHGQGHH